MSSCLNFGESLMPLWTVNGYGEVVDSSSVHRLPSRLSLGHIRALCTISIGDTVV